MLLKSYSILTTDPFEFQQFLKVISSGYNFKELNGDNITVLHYFEFGHITNDICTSPILVIRHPYKVREYLWKVGKIHFQQSGMSKNNPEFHCASKIIRRKILDAKVIWCMKKNVDNKLYDYYLRGSIQNVSEKVIALNSGLMHLEKKFHFVGADDNDSVIADELKSLRLIGLS